MLQEYADLSADASPDQRPLSVSDVTIQVKDVLEETLPPCWVMGEVSEFTHHGSGHRYFTLVDDCSQLSCVMFKWQGRGVRFVPERGTQILVQGHVSVYERGGRYQFYVTRMKPAGVGELALAFEQMKNRLEDEGLFDPERKRPLPIFPRSVGVVTSQSGAAIRDILQVLGRRAPGLQIVLAPARVQGPGAAGEIAKAIRDLNRFGDVDILIVGRGGGSPEDLWCFNEEVVARAIYLSAIPVISAVGHEIDYTIADYVADYRAATPSAAAEVVAVEQASLTRRVIELRRRLRQTMQMLLESVTQRIQDMRPQRLYLRLRDRLEQGNLVVDDRRHALLNAFDWYTHGRVEALRNAMVRLHDLSPLSGLRRGYSLCHRGDGKLVRDSSQLEIGDSITMRFQKGGARCLVEEKIDDEIENV
jgi:exodeoxyribonuclease VII large subunit